MDVYSLDGDWCVVKYGEAADYVPHDRLYRFYCLTEALQPGTTMLEGVATMLRDVVPDVADASRRTAE